MGDLPEGDIRPVRTRRQYAKRQAQDRVESHNRNLVATRYQHGGDGIRIERHKDACEQLIATDQAVYILKGGRSTKIHEWGHGPGLYIPF